MIACGPEATVMNSVSTCHMADGWEEDHYEAPIGELYYIPPID